jgi:hypothetical protein
MAVRASAPVADPGHAIHPYNGEEANGSAVSQPRLGRVCRRALDLFASLGSTPIAAERTGRTCLAAELEPRYCDIIVARWEAALSGGRAQRVGAEAV